VILAVALMAGRRYAIAVQPVPWPTPGAGLLLPDENIEHYAMRTGWPAVKSLHQFAGTSLAMAKQVMVEPQLFAMKMDADGEFLTDGPSALAPLTAYYSTDMNHEKYVVVAAPRVLLNWPNYIGVELRFFRSTRRSCRGRQIIQSQGPPQAAYEHPALRGWKIDLPELWKIADDDADFRGVDNLMMRMSSAEWLRQEDQERRMDCDPTVYRTESGDSQRLPYVPSGQAIVEIATEKLNTKRPPPKSCEGPLFLGHYLIADAATSDEIERGTYFRCQPDEE
jgi:hypothetical protein